MTTADVRRDGGSTVGAKGPLLLLHDVHHAERAGAFGVFETTEHIEYMSRCTAPGMGDA